MLKLFNYLGPPPEQQVKLGSGRGGGKSQLSRQLAGQGIKEQGGREERRGASKPTDAA